VTHDQIEALTFAEQVMVMTRGRTVQIGSASDLFERPQHTFVGHFIGSPGMNFLSARRTAAGMEVAGCTLPVTTRMPEGADPFTLGVRPEYVALAGASNPGTVPAKVTQAQDIGTYWLVSAAVGSGASAAMVRARIGRDQHIPNVGADVWLSIVGPHTCYYRHDELIQQAAR